MTLRQLLTHTRDIYNYTDNEGYLDLLIAESDKVKTGINFLVYALNKHHYFKPGEGSECSNTGYIFAGLIIVKVLRIHHSLAFRESILTPLGTDELIIVVQKKIKVTLFPATTNLMTMTQPTRLRRTWKTLSKRIRRWCQVLKIWHYL